MGAEEQPSAERSFPTVGRWLVTSLPRGWIFVAKFGIRQMVPDPGVVPARISLGQGELPDAGGFGGWVADQLRQVNHQLFNVTVAGPQPMPFKGASEAWLYFTRHTSPGGLSMLLAQTYVRLDLWVGVVSLTTHEPHLPAVRPDYEAFLKGLRITAT